ncbi:MAG TPA: formyltransferase family protein [Devosia sp.]|nr:formyltransferase family protein [Devosia sp.]
MLDTFLVLTGPTELPILSGRLTECNPEAQLVPVRSHEDLLGISDAVLARSRLIGFATPVIVPPRVLGALGHGAYNFHPGPPEFPGLCPASYAVFTQARRFGVTAHRMVERVDAGPIVGLITFGVAPSASVRDLELLSYRALARLFWQLAPLLAMLPEPLEELPVRWGPLKSSRRSAAALCEIGPAIGRDELDRLVAAFGSGPFGLAPTINLHGHRFRLVSEPPGEISAEPEQKPLAS